MDLSSVSKALKYVSLRSWSGLDYEEVLALLILLLYKE